MLHLIKINSFKFTVKYWFEYSSTKHLAYKTKPQLRFPTRLNNVHLQTNENKTFILN